MNRVCVGCVAVRPDPDAETELVVGLGAVVAEVVDDVWVLAVPPLSVGWTLIAG